MTLSEAIKHLESGGILLYPTDTVYGIGCLPQYVDKLLTIKPRTSGYILITDDYTRHQDWFSEPFSPPKTDKPTTWIVKASQIVPEPLVVDGHVAMREVSHKPTQELLQALKDPLISTSANLPGEPTPDSPKGLKAIFEFPILEGQNGGSKPSTIIHYTTRKIIRP